MWMLWQNFVQMTFSITQNDWCWFPLFSWWVLVQWQELPILYLHWSSVFWCVLRTNLCQAAVIDQLIMTVEDWMGDGSQGRAADVFVKCSFCQYVAGYVLRVAGRTIQYPFGLSFVLVCMWTIHSEGGELCTYNCKGTIWFSLVLQLSESCRWETNGLRCFLFYYLNHCELAVLLAIFLSPSSRSVHSRWVLIQVLHNLLELWGNSERNCSVN